MKPEKHVQLVRVPHAYRYDGVDVREEPILTLFKGYLDGIGFDSHQVADFHLQRHLRFEDTLNPRATDYVISVRQTGDQVHYLRRYVKALREHSGANIWIYGQTGRLEALDWPENVRIIAHDERVLAGALGLPAQGPGFDSELTASPYAHQLDLQPWQRALLRGSMETTRGCHYPCRFCFINVGDNYPKRWQVRSTHSLLSDLRRYRELGIQSVAFWDSEFLGAVRAGYEARRGLLRGIRDELPGTQYMIWNRADTLLAFDDFELLKESGLVNVFIGVESFSQADLDALKKRIKVADIIRCVERLRDLDIHVHMSFLTFNRNTTPRSLRENLDVLERLMSVKPRLLGLPHFSFTFESSWDETTLRPLSNKTYMGIDVMMRAQRVDGACFDARMEPLMEVYRLLKYEWTRKVTELTLERLSANDAEHVKIESWFEGLGRFCLATMREYLERYEKGTLGFEELDEARQELFQKMGNYYQRLPERLRRFSTLDDHAGRIEYDETRLVEKDEYWAAHIPHAPGELEAA
ncbi:B12-binding domain-containing radical SAM protein [Myxococcus sp. 1LA]